MKNRKKPVVGIIMGSKSDWTIMKNTCETLKSFHINYDVRVISAHRTPKRLEKFIKESKTRGIEVIIAAAGGAAHLAGVTASLTTIPVLGVPIESVLKGKSKHSFLEVFFLLNNLLKSFQFLDNFFFVISKKIISN